MVVKDGPRVPNAIDAALKNLERSLERGLRSLKGTYMELSNERLEILRKSGSSDVQDMVDEIRRLRKIESIARHIRDDLKRCAGMVPVTLEAELDDALFPDMGSPASA